MWAVEFVAAVLVAGAGIVWAGRHDAGETWACRLATVGLIVAAALHAVSVLQAQIPVVQNMRHEMISRQNGVATFEVTGEKVRRCERVGTEKARVVGPDGRLHEAALLYVDDLTPNSTRPVGLQHFGIWQVRFAVYAEPVSEVVVEVEHDCGRWVRRVITQVGPMAVPRPPNASIPSR